MKVPAGGHGHPRGTSTTTGTCRGRRANRIAELRERAGLSRVELAARVEVNPQTIGYLERGEYNPSLVLALRLADLFGLPIEEVFVRGDPAKP